VSVRALGRRLAHEALGRGEPLAWFEELYRADRATPGVVSWADLVPNPHLVDWLDREPGGGTALVVGSGYGDDAEELARRGWQVTAFDVAPTATAAARERFPASAVRYEVADVLAPPPAWRGAFDLVVEAYTLQVLPPELRAPAAAAIAGFVAPGGRLLAIARGRDAGDPPGEMPWPLVPDELRELFASLELERWEDFVDDEDPPVRRLRATYRTASAAATSAS
jgi:SAM-dependent methyltransferase